ncbi:hypothetical protein ACSFBF_07315 [Variovorax sp. ZT5P49]|uniref:hypothetical protein n=1 Tax=Variovorax sp. ZT5P49 TaxID=3443733 RepID=UPI003F47B22A
MNAFRSDVFGYVMPECCCTFGVKAVTFTSDTDFLQGTGGYGYLHAGAEVRLQQTLNLGSAVGSGISLVWDGVPSPALGAGAGNEDVLFQFNISVPAGGSVTLMNFLVMSGTDTGLVATDITARATEVDTQLADIANNFRTNFAYQRGLTQAQLDTVKNF